MLFLKKLTNLFLSVLLVFQSFAPALTVIAEGEEMITIDSDWEGTVFGDVGGNDKITAENFGITEVSDDHVNMYVRNNRGKLSGSTDGISYYYTNIPTDADFEFSVTADVVHFEPNNQVGFGIMLRDIVYDNVSGNEYATEDYIAVGALDQTMKAFTRFNGSLSKGYTLNEGNVNPSPGQLYEISARKVGQNVVVRVGDEEQVFTDVDRDFQYIGLFVSRNAEINYYNKSLTVSEADDSLTSISVDASAMKTEYLMNETLDLDGVRVIAHYADETEKVLDTKDYLVTGFDSSEVGTNTVTFTYGNQTATLDLEIISLEVVDLNITYLPARLSYFMGDLFESDGMVVEATYNNGETTRLSADAYEIDAPETFEKAGAQTITIRSLETPTQVASFDVEVSEAEIETLRISQQPQKRQYFLNEERDLTGLVVYAEYADGSRVRLLANDYNVSELDTTTAGTKELVLSYKGVEEIIKVNVKEREVTGLVITSYPKTTYTVGEPFSAAGFEIAKEFDNGDLEIVPESDYTIDVPALDTVGAEIVTVSVNDDSLDAIAFAISVVEAEELTWESIVFGQSISSEKNFVEVNEDGSVKLTALDGGGKVTGDHDGISFYYTELDALEDNFELRATIEVEEYAKSPDHDGQESFGMMARDDINTHLNSSVFASNIAAIGGYSGGTRNPNGIQLFARTGILAPDGEGSEGITNLMLKQEDRPLGTYELVLKKTNSGFVGSVDDGEEATIFEPEILSSMTDKMYVGFYVARLATINVVDFDMTITKAETDAPRVYPDPEPIAPAFDVTSLNRTALDTYTLRVQPTVNGTVTVRQGTEYIAIDHPVTAGEDQLFETTLTNAKTAFSITFYPDDTQYLTSYDPIVQNFSVEKRTYAGDIIVSPEGRKDGEGTLESPLDIDTAIDFVQAGQNIILQDGIYNRTSPLEIKKHNNGEEGKMKTLIAAEDASPVIDFGLVSEGGILSGDYWHVKGIDFRRSAGNTKGFTIGGNHNIIELAQFYENGDTGLQISRTDGSPNFEDWPSYNLILNVTSFDNRDPSNNNADGFGAKLTSGVGNVFRGAIAYNNIDDGWDLYTKSGSGKIGAVIIEDSIAYNNGFISDGSDHRGDGNGFKLGGEGIHVAHEIRNSLTFGNLTYGLTSNSNPGLIAENIVGVNNGSGNLSFTTYNHIPTDFTIEGMISYQTVADSAKDAYPARTESETNYFYDGNVSRNSNGVELSEENFESLDFESFEGFERDEEGNIIWGPFLNFISPVEEGSGEDEEEEEEEVDVNGQDEDESETDDEEDEVALTTLTIEPLRAGDTIIRGDGPAGARVFAEAGEILLGFTTINSPFEIQLTEALVEGTELEIYAVDNAGNRLDTVRLVVTAADIENVEDETDDVADEESETQEEMSETNLPATGTTSGVLTVLGIVSLLFGFLLKPFGKKE